MKKVLNVFLAVLMCLTLCLGFTGCKFDLTKEEQEKIDDYKPNENAEVTISLCLKSGTYERAIMNSWANAFQEKYPNVGFDFDEKGRQISAMDGIVSLASAKALPDIIWTAGDQHSPYSERYFLDLKDLDGAKEFFDSFYPELIDTTHVSSTDEGIWFVPRDYNAIMIYYNKNIFDAAGVEYPKNNWTYEEFLATCEAIQNSGKVHRAIENDIGWHPYSYTMMKNNGLEYFDDKGNIILDCDEAEAWYDTLQAFNTKYVKQGAMQNFITYDPDAPKSNYAMYINVRPSLPEIAAKANTGGWKLGAVTFPNFKQADGSNGYVGVGCSGYAINKDLENNPTKLEWAWKFLQFCMSEEGYEVAAQWGVLVPALPELANKGSWRDYKKGKIEVDPDAFVNFDANGIFLNYYNVQPIKTHSTVTTTGMTFWAKTVANGATYTEAIKAYLKTLGDSGITK